ncbi:o-succinylbenzoate synthase [Prochlorococcus sp. MIT 1300]|uniref:o-succinylbenzoate synthase n=1 Tax=Prochlorococcus sp. MIT 1300 TaxID=3096218 RepID=UPI002A75DD67|nr:o-succinylbenzoate synthase [Prochlorococcus sp. MIT 1300]
MEVNIQSKPFSFQLIKKLKTSQGFLKFRRGFLLRLETSSGQSGWGEVSPFQPNELRECKELLTLIGKKTSRSNLESQISQLPGSLAFGIGAALAEIDHFNGGKAKGNWLKAPRSAVLLPDPEKLLDVIHSTISKSQKEDYAPTFKWKVGIRSNSEEQELLNEILSCLPSNAKLRLDANGAWNRKTAYQWVNSLINQPSVEWLEQPLPTLDIEGLLKLSQKIPIALDESLTTDKSLIKSWKSWQVRRPILEGDPRKLLQELEARSSHKMLSTSFETGIGQRWVHHLSALQQQGPTPTAPGLAEDWFPDNDLFSSNPITVWEAA